MRLAHSRTFQKAQVAGVWCVRERVLDSESRYYVLFLETFGNGGGLKRALNPLPLLPLRWGIYVSSSLTWARRLSDQ